jgi:hypothetical protein
VPNKTTRLKVEARDVAMQQVYAELALTPVKVESLSPLQCMLTVMHLALDGGNLPLALQCAGMAAPYIHPKLTSSEVKVSGTLTTKSDDELAQEIAQLEAKLAAAEMLR